MHRYKKKIKKYIENANDFIIVRNKYKFVWMIEAIMEGYIHNFMLIKLNESNRGIESFLRIYFERLN